MKVSVIVHFDHTIDSDLSVAASIAKHCEETEAMIYPVCGKPRPSGRG